MADTELTNRGDIWSNADIVATVKGNKVYIDGNIGGKIYTTDEHKVGLFMEDELLEKTIIIDTPTTGAWVDLEHNLNITDCVSINAIAYITTSDGSGWVAMDSMRSTSLNDRLAIEVYENMLTYYVGSGYTISKIVITLDYVKAETNDN